MTWAPSPTSPAARAAAAAFEGQFLVDLLIEQAGLGPDMSDENALFDAAHGNVAGSGAAPSETTLSAARLAMRKQTGPSRRLDRGDAATSCSSRPISETATLKGALRNSGHDHRRCKPVRALVAHCRAALDRRGALVCFADAAQIDGLGVRLSGRRAGTANETRAGFEVDGVEVKVRLDYGAGFVDHRGAYSNAGQ